MNQADRNAWLVRRMSAVCIVCALAAPVSAHPVPKDNHDRTIVVRLHRPIAPAGAARMLGLLACPGQGPMLAAGALMREQSDRPRRIQVRVEYRLEVDETTVLLNDMKPFRDEVDPFAYRDAPLKYYREFTRIYRQIYADRLLATVNGKPLAEFRCLWRRERLRDADGTRLGHLRCDFLFESSFDLSPDGKTKFDFREQNYLLEPGQIVVSLVNETSLPLIAWTAPDDALRKRAVEKPQPGDDARLREISATFAPFSERKPVTPPTPQPDTIAQPPAARPPQPPASHDERFSLLRLIVQTDYGFWLTMLLAFVFGAAHALTPGHGKTLVAAYLVGERGTVWHALYLGLVTTLTHTGVVMILAAILTFLPQHLQHSFQTWIQGGLGLIMGLIVACMGFWLLLQRLAGRADHIHLDGGHHHHGAPTPAPTSRTLSWWGLTILGMTGGMIPCWDAVGVLTLTTGTSHFWLVLPAVTVFSAGLAIVLVAIGILVVQVPRFAESRFGNGRLLRALPIVSAILVTLMGLWLCYEGVHGM